MKPQSVLRTSVSLMWVLFFLGLALTILLRSSLPSQLRDWRAAQATRGPSAAELVLGLAGGFAFILGGISSVGLVRLRRWAAWPFLVATVVAYALMPFLGPTVEHAATSAVNGAFSVLTGVTLGVAFFTDALKEPRAQPGAAPTGGPASCSDKPGATTGPPSGAET